MSELTAMVNIGAEMARKLATVGIHTPQQLAAEGAEASKGSVSKFGRAKSYGEKTIGTPDAGAMSMSYFFQGLAQA